MKQAMIRFLSVVLITLYLSACGNTSGNTSGNQAVSPTAEDVTGAYGNTGIFVKNWDDGSYPILYALIRNSSEWNAVFGAIAGSSSAPPVVNTYDKNDYLVVARTVPMTNTGAVFQVDSAEGGAELVVKYLYTSPSGSSWLGKRYLVVKLAKQQHQRVVLVENGRQVGILDIACGQWSVPALSP